MKLHSLNYSVFNLIGDKCKTILLLYFRDIIKIEFRNKPLASIVREAKVVRVHWLPAAVKEPYCHSLASRRLPRPLLRRQDPCSSSENNSQKRMARVAKTDFKRINLLACGFLLIVYFTM